MELSVIQSSKRMAVVVLTPEENVWDVIWVNVPYVFSKSSAYNCEKLDRLLEVRS